MRREDGGRQGGSVSTFTNSNVDIMLGSNDDEDYPVNAEAGEGGALGNIPNEMEWFAGAASLKKVCGDNGDTNSGCVALGAVVDGKVVKFVPLVSSIPKKEKHPSCENNNATSSQQAARPTVQEIRRDKLFLGKPASGILTPAKRRGLVDRDEPSSSKHPLKSRRLS